MPRGVIPRQPARTGRQDKVRAARLTSPAKSNQARSNRKQTALPTPKTSAARTKSSDKSGKPPKDYNPVAPERVTEILKRLNDLYPEVTCALTHASAWELLVATILSAQSTDDRILS